MDDVVVEIPAEVLLRGNDGTVFPMTAAAWDWFGDSGKLVYDRADCEDEARALEDMLAAHIGQDEDDPSDLMDPAAVFFGNRLGVYQLLVFLLSCGGFTVEKVQ